MLFVRLRIFIVSTLLLAGCASQVNMLPTLTPDTIIDDNQGFVVARVINASAYSLPFNQLTITPENLNESEDVKLERLLSLPAKMEGTTVFFSPVQAGTYALSSIRAFHSNGDYWYSRFISADATFGVFTVSPGVVTDLGTLVYYPKSQDDKYLNMLLRIPETEPGEVLNKYFPFFDANDKPFISWNEDSLDDERVSDYVSVVQNPVTYNTRYLAPDNTLYFLTKLGVMLIRTVQGDWAMDAVDTNLELTTIAQNKRGDVIVGGGEGTLFWKPTGEEWTDVSLGSQYKIEKVIFSNMDTVDVIVIENTKLSVLRSTISKPFDWKELNHYTSIDGWRSIPKPEQSKTPQSIKPKRILGANLTELEGETLITVKEIPSRSNPVFSKPRSTTYRYKPADWDVRLLAKKPKIASVINAGKIKLGIKPARFWSWDGKPDYFRYVAETGSWAEITTSVNRCPNGIVIRGKLCPTSSPSDTNKSNTKKKKSKKKRTSSKNALYNSRKTPFTFLSIPVFKSDMNGIAIVSFSEYNAWTSKRTTEIKMLTTDDGGKTWLSSEHKLFNDYCGSIVPEISDRLLVSCNGASGDFYESFDEGKNWKHVRQHENF